MDVYIVLDGSTIVAVSARLQGAEERRANRALLLADQLHHGDRGGGWSRSQAIIYDRQQIITMQLQDAE
jgi:hypothetical protein